MYTALFFVLGFLSSQILVSPYQSAFTEIRSPGNYKFINPLIECETANFAENSNLSHIKSSLENIINQKINNNEINFASVYYRDLNNGPWLGINEKELFSPSSLIKVPLMMAYYKLAEKNPEILNQEITNTKIYNPQEQNITPEITLAPNQNYTVDELINRMIVYSDNMAYELLNEKIDSKTLVSVYNDLGVDISKGYTDPNGNILSVKSYASFFRILYNSSYINKEMSEKALLLLSQTKFNQGIVAGVPKNVIVAHKFGERQYLETRQYQLHDCGIVYLPGKPYLICIMTRGPALPQLENTIKQISTTIYTNLSP